mmetsp:Transcript_51991/g.93618  ORF Transcript_51991/g.93618 Transcript_51991/m.93618 type:complete len:80 (+) Transcript_51991:1239-1478(+)
MRCQPMQCRRVSMSRHWARKERRYHQVMTRSVRDGCQDSSGVPKASLNLRRTRAPADCTVDRKLIIWNDVSFVIAMPAH